MGLLGRIRDTKRRTLEMIQAVLGSRDARPLLAGMLEVMPFELLAQAISAAWGTGVLRVECDGQVGKVYFENGAIVAARIGPLERQAAIDRIYRQKAGFFLFQPGVEAPVRDMEGTVILHLLHAARAREGTPEVAVQRHVRSLTEAAGP